MTHAIFRNPWLAIPLDDYERHMALPSVGQAQLLGDLERDEPPFAAVELVYAALLFEYVEPARVLRTIAAKLVPGGVLVAVLQLPSAGGAVTPSPYSSLSTLTDLLTLRAPAALQLAAAAAGPTPRASTTATAFGGKQFAVLTFAKP